VLRRILGSKREEEVKTGEDYTTRSFITCTLLHILLGWSNQGGTWHVACMGEMRNACKILVRKHEEKT
jgi:hypothetical protein